MSSPDTVRLQHMHDAAVKAVKHAQGRSRADLETDELFGLAIVRLLEIIGEASKNVTQATKDANPHIPWRQISGARDRLIHGYFNVDLDIVWQTITQDLPPLIAVLDVLLSSGDP
jgi:uncharacterized protein with HEPN domain